EWRNCMCATNRLYSRLRKPEVLHLAFLNQVLYRLRHAFDWHVGIDAVLIEQIDNIGPKSFQRSVGDFLDMLGPAIEADLLTFGTNFETEFGGYHYLPAEWSQRFADQFFVCKRTVHFSGIKKCYAELDGLPQQRDHLILVFGRTVAKAHSHTAEPNGGHFQRIALSKFAVLHRFLRPAYVLITPI